MIALGAELSISPVGPADRHMKTLHQHSLLIANFCMNQPLPEGVLCGYCVEIEKKVVDELRKIDIGANFHATRIH